MRKRLSKSNLIIAQKGISLVVVFAVLMISLVAIAPWTYGWFAKNNTVTASGMHTQAYQSKFDVSYAVKTQTGTDETTGNPVYEYVASDLADLFAGIKAPGDSIEIQVTVTSKSYNQYPVTLTGFGLEAPTAAEDVPKIDSEGNVRYLSTELTTQLLAVTESTVKSTHVPVFLRTTSATDKTLGVDEEASEAPGTAGRIDYISFVDGTISLNKGESVTFTIKLSFVNTDYDQNIYKDFAGTGGKCERRFFFTYEDVIPQN